MTLADLLADARAAGLTVTVDAGRLVIRGPRAAEHLALALLARRPAVLAHLAATAARPCGHWDGTSRSYCRSTTGVRRYLNGHRCPNHRPIRRSAL
jgi:hypothetical protein